MPLTLPFSDFINGTTADADQVDANFLAIKTFVDALETSMATFLLKAGGTITGDINGGGSQTITNIRSGTGANDPITLAQAEQMIIALLPVGIILPYYGTGTPSPDFLVCDYSTFNASSYPLLYGLLGTNRTPDLRGRGLVGLGVGDGLTTRALGAYGGTETVTLVTNELPSHTHTVVDNGHTHTITDPGHAHPQVAGTATVGTTATQRTWYSTMNCTTISMGCNTGSVLTGITINNSTTGITLSTTGTNTAHNNMSPFKVVNFIIKAR